MKILVIDNYDSFTYNLVQYLERIGNIGVTVARNDKISLDQVSKFEKILISPGPGIPEEAGLSREIIAVFGKQKSILGVCLGHQAIAEVYGGSIRNLDRVYHGVSSEMILQTGSDYLFSGIPVEFDAGRYHSWIVEEDGLPDCLEITVRNREGEIMAIRHREHDVRGVQFHPESVLTEFGGMIIKNWITGEKQSEKIK